MSDFNLVNGGSPSIKRIPSVLEDCKSDFVLILRNCFSSTLADENLRFNEDKNLTKIQIFKGFPNVIEFYPSIFITANYGDFSFKYLNNDFISEDTNKSIFSSPVEFTISINIYANSQLERERIIDHLIFFMKYLFLGEFRSKNFVFYKQLNLGSEGTEERHNRLIYTASMNIPCFSEYQSELDANEFNRLISSNVSFSMEEKI